MIGRDLGARIEMAGGLLKIGIVAHPCNGKQVPQAKQKGARRLFFPFFLRSDMFVFRRSRSIFRDGWFEQPKATPASSGSVQPNIWRSSALRCGRGEFKKMLVEKGRQSLVKFIFIFTF